MSVPVPNERQRTALGVRGSSVALSAGAGCGKTSVLTERFLGALDGEDAVPLDRVVALTFTNKAARELRERIRAEARRRLADGSDPARWRAILRGLEAARIGTFHSFCGEILRDHAIEAGIDPSFVVPEESISLAIRDSALDQALRDRLGAHDPDLIELAVEFGLGAVRKALLNLLDHRSSGDIGAWTSRTARELVDLWVDRWSRSVRPGVIAMFLEAARPCLELIQGPGLDHPKTRERLGQLVEALGRLPDQVEPDPAIAAIRELAKITGLTAKGCWPSDEFRQCIKEHFESIRAAADKARGDLAWDETTSLLAAEQGLRFARLATLAMDRYDRLKRDRCLLDYDDLLIVTRDLLLAHPETVARTLADSVDLILVDEFQDTDSVQGRILDLLAGPDLERGRLFLVGDTKQSIYRFRGARPELFRTYRERFPEGGRLELTENFRSVPAVLDFVNALFAETFTEPGSALEPGGNLDPEGSEAAVTFLWAARERPETPIRPDAEGRRVDEARRIARYLRGRFDLGWAVRDRSLRARRPAHPGDVTFLFRSLSDSIRYEEALAAEGFDYLVVGGSGFFNQQEVLDLINVLTVVEDPLDPVALAGALRSPFFSVSDDALFWLAREPEPGAPYRGLEAVGGPLGERLPEADRARGERARRLLADWRAAKDRMPIGDLIERILDDSGYEASLIGEPFGDRKRANARKLVRMARQFDELGGLTVSDFVERLRADLRSAAKETQAATTDEAGPVVRLMSIHQAKGLEFPIVVLPDLDRKRPGQLERVVFDGELGPLVNPIDGPDDDSDEGGPSGSVGWSSYRFLDRAADDAEALRLLYVAATRARDFLILSSASPADTKPTSAPMALLDRRFDRSTGQPLVELPDGLNPPKVAVVFGDELPPASSPTIRAISRPRLADVARVIQEGMARPGPSEAPNPKIPSSVELDPAWGLGPVATRLDRLIRTALLDPDCLDPARTNAVVARASRRVQPVATPSLVELAGERLAGWPRTLAQALVRSAELERFASWVETAHWRGRPMTFLGAFDFLFRDSSGDVNLLNFSDPTADEAREQLRLLLSIRAVARLPVAPIRRAWRLRLGPGGGLRGVDLADDGGIEAAIGTVLERDSGPEPRRPGSD